MSGIERRLVYGLTCLGSLAFVSSKIYLEETFNDAKWQERWVVSKWKEAEDKHGSWHLDFPTWHNKDDEDQGLKTSEDGKHFTISAQIDPPITTHYSDMKLIIQFQVQTSQKEEKVLDNHCHGEYIKVGPSMKDPTMFGSDTPYAIMFGPDVCGYSRKTHVIFNHKGKNVEKKSELLYYQHNQTTHLYRMVILPKGRVRIDVDEKRIYSGDIGEDWEMTVPKEIPDPDDRQPKKWDSNFHIDDPHDEKPEEWVDQRRVPNYDAEKPEDWDDDTDGVWEIPMKDNPEFIGKWRPRQVPNPKYKGWWEPRKIPNPEYAADETIGHWEIGYVGFDWWQVAGGTLIDNVLITDDYDEANLFARKWRRLSEYEEVERLKTEKEKNRKEMVKAEADDDDGGQMFDAPHEWIETISAEDWEYVQAQLHKAEAKQRLGPHGYLTPGEKMQQELRKAHGKPNSHVFKIFSHELDAIM